MSDQGGVSLFTSCFYETAKSNDFNEEAILHRNDNHFDNNIIDQENDRSRSRSKESRTNRDSRLNDLNIKTTCQEECIANNILMDRQQENSSSSSSSTSINRRNDFKTRSLDSPDINTILHPLDHQVRFLHWIGLMCLLLRKRAIDAPVLSL